MDYKEDTEQGRDSDTTYPSSPLESTVPYGVRQALVGLIATL